MVRMISRTKVGSLVKSFGQSILSLSFNLGGMLAGTLLVLYLDVFSITSWAFLVFPGILSVRGAIGGLFSGRLSTALHVGTVRASYTNNTRYFYLLLSTIITLTLECSIMMGVTASLFGVFFLGITASDSFAILAVLITTMGLSLAFISPITLGISVLAFKKGLDPDVIVYPVISTVADVLVTICYIVVLRGFFSVQWGRYLIGVFNLVFLLVVCYLVSRNYKEKEFLKKIGRAHV